MTPPPSPVDNNVMVGSVVESRHTVDMPGIDVVTRSKALRAPRWALVLAGVVLLSDGYWGGIFRDLVTGLLDAS
jgi:hypothetical protein